MIHEGNTGSLVSAYAEDHGLWPWMNAKRITLRSLVRRRVCFGGFRRRTWRDHGLCPWGSILLKKILYFLYELPEAQFLSLEDLHKSDLSD
jgi:hypothetical protein